MLCWLLLTRGAVVLLQFAKLKIFKNKPVLQNVLHTTRILLNPQIAEAVEFCSSISDIGLLEQYPVPMFPVPIDNTPSFEEDFMCLTPRKCIGQLLSAPKDGHGIVLATIVGIVEEGGWFYPACNRCHRAIKLKGMLYNCAVCESLVLNVLPRNKIMVVVVDGVDSAVFILFDRDAEILLGKSCASLLSDSDKVCKDSGTP